MPIVGTCDKCGEYEKNALVRVQDGGGTRLWCYACYARRKSPTDGECAKCHAEGTRLFVRAPRGYKRTGWWLCPACLRSTVEDILPLLPWLNFFKEE